MRHPVETFGHHHDRKCGGEKRQAGDMTKPDIAGKEIAHVGAEDAGDTQCDPVSRSERRQMEWLHGD